MKRIWTGLLALGVCLVFSACRAQPNPLPSVDPVPPASTDLVTPVPSPTENAYTEEDAYAAFARSNEKNNLTGRTPTQCVLTEDGFQELAAVLLFTDDNRNNECYLSFVYQNGVCQEMSFASNQTDTVRDFVVVPEGAFTYDGEGTVSISAKEVGTGGVYRFCIQVDVTEGNVGYTVTSQAL